MAFNFGTPSFGAPATSSTGSFGFGTSTASNKRGFSGFGTTATTAQAPSFPAFGTTTTTSATAFSGFGAPTTSSGFNFGSSFGKPFGTTATQSGGLGTFGGSLGLGSGLSTGFGQQQPAQQQQQIGAPQPSELEQVTNSVFNCCVFGNEKDQVLAQWNLLQACWGTGKGFYNSQLPPVEYTPKNPYYRFKAIVYSVKPTVEARDGYVALQFNKKGEELRPQKDQMQTALNNLINKPNMTLHVDSIRPLSEASSLVLIYVEEKAQSGQTKKIPSPDLANFLANNQKQSLINMGVQDVFSYVSPDKDQIQEYLNTPPAGIDPTLWKQAQSANPNPDKFIPVPLLGFGEVRWRYNCQVEETMRHQAFLDQIADNISKLKSQNEESRLKILEYKQKVVDLEHRILKLMVKQQITRNIGVSLQPEEEVLRSQLDSIQSRLNSPQLSGKLTEMLTQIRLHKQEASQQDPDAYNMTAQTQQEIKQFLAMQQSGIKYLMDIMQGDMEDMKKMEAEMNKSLKQKN